MRTSALVYYNIVKMKEKTQTLCSQISIEVFVQMMIIININKSSSTSLGIAIPSGSKCSVSLTIHGFAPLTAASSMSFYLYFNLMSQGEGVYMCLCCSEFFLW